MSRDGTPQGAEANERYPSTKGMTLGVETGRHDKRRALEVAEQLKQSVANLDPTLQHFGALVEEGR